MGYLKRPTNKENKVNFGIIYKEMELRTIATWRNCCLWVKLEVANRKAGLSDQKGGPRDPHITGAGMCAHLLQDQGLSL